MDDKLYTSAVPKTKQQVTPLVQIMLHFCIVTFSNLKGLVAMDISISDLDINQCEMVEAEQQPMKNIIQHFQNTHKCHNTSVVRMSCKDQNIKNMLKI